MTGNSTSKPRSRQGLLSIGGLFLAAAVALVATTSHAASPDDVRRMIVEEARETMVPASLAIAVAQVESGLRPDHQGADGARGVFQLLPETAEGLGLEPRQLWQPRTNIRAGLTVLDRLLDRTEGRWDEALKAFAGRRDNGRATNAGRYVTDVLGWERRYAERLAAQDAVDGRRREVLMGHDDWGARERDAEAAIGRDSLPAEAMIGDDEEKTNDRADLGGDPLARDDVESAELPPYLREDSVDPMLDDDTDVEAAVRIYRGGRGRQVEITIYEEQYEVSPPPPPPAWHPAPPRRIARPAPWSDRNVRGWRTNRHVRKHPGPRWSARKARRLKRAARRMARRHGW